MLVEAEMAAASATRPEKRTTAGFCSYMSLCLTYYMPRNRTYSRFALMEHAYKAYSRFILCFFAAYVAHFAASFCFDAFDFTCASENQAFGLF